MLTIILYILHGILGSLLHTLVWATKAEDLKEFESIKRYVIGGLAGYIYYLLVSSYAFPDSFMAIVFGYFSEDVIESIMERFKKVI